jgi:hypothetical protein
MLPTDTEARIYLILVAILTIAFALATAVSLLSAWRAERADIRAERARADAEGAREDAQYWANRARKAEKDIAEQGRTLDQHFDDNATIVMPAINGATVTHLFSEVP